MQNRKVCSVKFQTNAFFKGKTFQFCRHICSFKSSISLCDGRQIIPEKGYLLGNVTVFLLLGLINYLSFTFLFFSLAPSFSQRSNLSIKKIKFFCSIVSCRNQSSSVCPRTTSSWTWGFVCSCLMQEGSDQNEPDRLFQVHFCMEQFQNLNAPRPFIRCSQTHNFRTAYLDMFFKSSPW